MTIKKTHEAELDSVRYIKERDILVAPPPPPITLQMILHVVPFQGNCVAWDSVKYCQPPAFYLWRRTLKYIFKTEILKLFCYALYCKCFFLALSPFVGLFIVMPPPPHPLHLIQQSPIEIEWSPSINILQSRLLKISLIKL